MAVDFYSVLKKLNLRGGDTGGVREEKEDQNRPEGKGVLQKHRSITTCCQLISPKAVSRLEARN